MTSIHDIKNFKKEIEAVIEKNSKKLFLLIFCITPFLIIYEFKDIISAFLGQGFLTIADWLKLLAYSFIAFVSMHFVFKKTIKDKNIDNLAILKNYLVFTGKIILLLICVKTVPTILKTLISSISFLLPFFPVFHIIFYAFSVYIAVKFSFIIPEHIKENKLNIGTVFKKNNIEAAPMIFSGLLVALPFLIIIVLFDYLMPIFAISFFNHQNDIINVVLQTIFNLPITLFLEPYILIIGSITLACFYKKSFN